MGVLLVESSSSFLPVRAGGEFIDGGIIGRLNRSKAESTTRAWVRGERTSATARNRDPSIPKNEFDIFDLEPSSPPAPSRD